MNMGNQWTAERYFYQAYALWIEFLKGQTLECIYSFNEYIVEDDFDFNELDDFCDDDEYYNEVKIIKLKDGRQYKIVFDDDNNNNPSLIVDVTDITQELSLSPFQNGDGGIVSLWVPILQTQNAEIIDIMPNLNMDDYVDGVILIFRTGNLLLSRQTWDISDVPARRYIRRKECRAAYEEMAKSVSQYKGYRDIFEKHINGRQKFEKHVSAKLKGRTDIAILLGRDQLGYSGNFIPDEDETCYLIVQITIIVGASNPDVVFDTLNWFCKKICAGKPNSAIYPIEQFYNY